MLMHAGESYCALMHVASYYLVCPVTGGVRRGYIPVGTSGLVMVILLSSFDSILPFILNGPLEASYPRSNLLVAKVLRSSAADTCTYRTTVFASNIWRRTAFRNTQPRKLLSCAMSHTAAQRRIYVIRRRILFLALV